MPHAKFAGTMFLVAMVASLTGGALVQGVLDRPDQLLDHRATLVTGVALELVNALAVVGIAAALWTPLRRTHPGMTAGYLGVRTIEAMVCVAAAFLPVTLLSLTEQGDGTGFAGLLGTARDTLVDDAVPLVFGVGALLLYAMLYRSSLVPRYLTVWGLLAAVGILVAVPVTEPAVKGLLVLPMIVNEVYLGIYLLARGLRETAPAPAVLEPAR